MQYVRAVDCAAEITNKYVKIDCSCHDYNCKTKALTPGIIAISGFFMSTNFNMSSFEYCAAICAEVLPSFQSIMNEL
jgi:hypothetical protein